MKATRLLIGALLVTAFLALSPGVAAHHADPGECKEYEGERSTETHCGALAEADEGRFCLSSEKWDYNDGEYRQHYEESTCLLTIEDALLPADSESASSSDTSCVKVRTGTGQALGFCHPYSVDTPDPSTSQSSSSTSVTVLCSDQGSGAGGNGTGGGSYERSCAYAEGCVLYHEQGQYKTGEKGEYEEDGLICLDGQSES